VRCRPGGWYNRNRHSACHAAIDREHDAGDKSGFLGGEKGNSGCDIVAGPYASDGHTGIFCEACDLKSSFKVIRRCGSRFTDFGIENLIDLIKMHKDRTLLNRRGGD
jgi:hypothetical protein